MRHGRNLPAVQWLRASSEVLAGARGPPYPQSRALQVASAHPRRLHQRSYARDRDARVGVQGAYGPCGDAARSGNAPAGSASALAMLCSALMSASPALNFALERRQHQIPKPTLLRVVVVGLATTQPIA